MSRYYIRDKEYSQYDIENLSMEQMAISNINYKRPSLFKYFPNIITKDENDIIHNYSIDALKNNTVFLSSPKDFDDPYDCNIYEDYNVFSLQRIRYYASLLGIIVKQEWNYADIAREIAVFIYKHISSGGTIESLFEFDKNNEIVKLHQEHFILSLKIELLQPNADDNSYYKAINHVIDKEYNDLQETANRFRIACFAETPYSMLMWSHYARSHQGFCIEYEMPDYSDNNIDIYHNLFPVIYTDTRKSLSELNIREKENGNWSRKDLFELYKYGLLCKSLEWKYQQEWRLISCDKLFTDDNYNCRFFKIKKVYLGNKMPKDKRVEIIEICKSKNILYSGVIISPDKFEMKDCSMLCENCKNIR